jgi:hypothetical protein
MPYDRHLDRRKPPSDRERLTRTSTSVGRQLFDLRDLLTAPRRALKAAGSGHDQAEGK